MTAAAITGVGVISPLGDRPETVAEALRTGRASFAPLPGGPGAAAAIPDFDAARYATIRGLRLYSRPTRMAVAAVQLALNDAGLTAGAVPSEELGAITACTLGHIETLLEYDRSVATQGPLRGNPALMPLSLPSSPGAAVALSFGAKAFSMALAGATAGLDGLGLGARMLRAGRARVCVVVASFGLSPELSLAASRAGRLSPEGDPRPFDRRRAGTSLGEGAVAFVLERPDEARARGASPRAAVAGQAAAFAVAPASAAPALERACATAWAEAGSPELGLVSAGANGSVEGDRIEAAALRAVLGGSAPRVPVTAVASCLGECFDASGLFQCVAALEAIRSARIPPIRGLEQPEPEGLRLVREPLEAQLAHALVTLTSPDGGCSAAVLSRIDDR